MSIAGSYQVIVADQGNLAELSMDAKDRTRVQHQRMFEEPSLERTHDHSWLPSKSTRFEWGYRRLECHVWPGY